jgi:hypothetical protein
MGSAESIPDSTINNSAHPNYRSYMGSEYPANDPFVGKYKHDESLNGRSETYEAVSSDAKDERKKLASAKTAIKIKSNDEKHHAKGRQQTLETKVLSKKNDLHSLPINENEESTHSDGNFVTKPPLVPIEAKRTVISDGLNDEITRMRDDPKIIKNAAKKKQKRSLPTDEGDNGQSDENQPSAEKSVKKKKRTPKTSSPKIELEDAAESSDSKPTKNEFQYSSLAPSHTRKLSTTMAETRKPPPNDTRSPGTSIDYLQEYGVDNDFEDSIGSPRTLDQNSAQVHSPHKHDILMGRGNGVAQWPGNCVFRVFCWNAREAYHNAIRNEKGKVAEQIIDNVRNRNPPGRFLEKSAHEYYTEVPHERVKEKICQALREKKWTPNAKDESYSNNNDSHVARDSRFTKLIDTAVSLSKCQLDISLVGKSATFSKSNVASTKNAKGSAKSTLLETMKEFQAAPEIKTGTRVAVYWPLDDKYFDATVVQSHPRTSNYFFLMYDDNESEWIDLNTVKYRVLAASTGDSKPVAKKQSLRRKLPLKAPISASLKSDIKSKKKSKPGVSISTLETEKDAAIALTKLEPVVSLSISETEKGGTSIATMVDKETNTSSTRKTEG